MIEKIYDELIELFNNSGKEFLEEMISFLKENLPNKCLDHTVLIIEDSEWKIGASTIINRSEREALFKIAKEELQNLNREWLSFSICREGVNNHILIPMIVGEHKVVGIWIIESYEKEKVIYSTNIAKISKLIALLIQLKYDERICAYNRYLDDTTELLGKQYFYKMVERLRNRSNKVLIVVYRKLDYREEVRMNGTEKIMKECNELIAKICDLKLGNVFALAEDTFAILTVESPAEVYARTKYLIEKREFGSTLKVLILNSLEETDIQQEIENRFLLCGSGKILLPDSIKQNPLLKIFEESGKENLQQVEQGKKKLEEYTDVLDLLEKKGLL